MKVKQNLSPNGFQTGIVELIVKDKDGIVKQVHKQPMDSFVSNYWKIIYYGVRRETATLTRFGGTTASKGYSTYFNAKGNSGDYKGVVVGSGNTAVTITDTALDTLITHGTGSGQLEYNSMGTRVLEFDTGNDFIYGDYERVFVNNSGTSVDVNELGMAGYPNTTATQTNPCLIVRDVLNTTITISHTDTLTVRYRLKINGVNKNMRDFLNFDTLSFEIEKDVIDVNTSTMDNACLLGDASSQAGVAISGASSQVAIDYTNVDALWINPQFNGGNIKYGAAYISPLIIDAGQNKISFYVEKDFTNHGATAVTVRSLMLVGSSSEGAASSTTRNLKAHKILPIAITINPGQTKTGKWVFEYSIV